MTQNTITDGLYLFPFASVKGASRAVPHATSIHDQNFCLMAKKGNNVSVRRYIELERLTRQKHSTTPFASHTAYNDFIAGLLASEGIKPDSVHILDFSSVSSPKAHIFSSIFMKGSDFFQTHTILALSLDNHSLGAVCRKGKIEYFKIGSLARLWRLCRKAFGKPEGNLMALASTPLTELKSGRERLAAKASQSLQKHSFAAAEKIINKALAQFSLDPKTTVLALSGGFALNCSTTSYLRKTFGFNEIIVPPVTGNSGQSLGQGLMYFYDALGSKMSFPPLSPFLGQSFTYKGRQKDERGHHSGNLFSAVQFTRDIERGIVIWFEGAAEIGPRALGHRSFLADPRKLKNKDILNRIKGRESWRPVAPTVLREAMADFFTPVIDSPFMLELVEVKPDKAALIPAAVHFDGTARVQTLTKTPDTALLYRGLTEFYKKTGIPMFCNTSLNAKGEPLVNTPAEALALARSIVRKGAPDLASSISALYINGRRYRV